MFYQILLVCLSGVGIHGAPQAYQITRQVVYAQPYSGIAPQHPYPTLQHHLLTKTGQQPIFYPQQTPQVYLQSGVAGQPLIYYFTPDGNVFRQEGGGSGGSTPSFPALSEVWNGFVGFVTNQIPLLSPLLPQAPTTAPAAGPSSPQGGTAPEKIEEQEQSGSSVTNPEKVTTHPAVMAPGVVAPDPEVSAAAPARASAAVPQSRFYIGQQLPASVHRLPNNQLYYRVQPQVDAFEDKAGSAAIAFQKFLSQAKVKKYKVPSSEEAVEVGHRDANNEQETTTQPPTTTTDSGDSETIESQDLGPSIAQAKPQAVSVAGPGGLAAAAPIGTAVVGPGGMALSAPSATAVAGAKGPKGPGSQSKLRGYLRQASGGYYLHY